MLFGHHNNDDVNQPMPDPAPPVQVSPTLNPLAVDPTTGVSLPVANEPADVVPAAVATPAPSVLDQPAPVDSGFAGGMPLPPPPAPITPPPAPTTAPLPATLADPLDAPAAAPVPEPIAEPAQDVPPPPEPAALPEPPAPTTQPEPVMPPEPAPLPEPVPEVPVMPLDDEPAEDPQAVPAGEPVDLDNLLDLKQHALEQLTPLVDKLDQTPEERFRTKMMMIQSTDDQTLIKDAYEAAMAITDEKNRAQALLDIVNEINYFTAPQNNQ